MVRETDWFPLFLSLRVALLATACSFVVGLSVAYVLARRRFFGRELVIALVTLPVLLPPTVLGYYLLQLLGRQGPIGRLLDGSFGVTVIFSWVAAVIASAVVSMPFLIQTARAAFEGVEPDLEAAARTLGRSEWAIFFTLTLPLSWRGILAGTALCFARAMGEFGATLMIAGNIPGRTQTLPVAIYDAVQSNNQDLANYLVLTITFVTIMILLLLGQATRALRW